MAIQNSQQGIISNQLTPPIPKPVVEPTAQPVQQVEQPARVAPPADEYKAPTVQPITTQVDVPTETVESRLSDITAKGSRYTDLAKADAIRQANTRGLINTTMAGAAGTEAAIRAALPIAQQDAKTFVDTRMMNQQERNEFLRNRQSANLNLETAAQASRLQKGEMQLGSQLTQEEAAQRSGLTREENTLLNELSMKRDVGQAVLTQEENEQLSRLEMRRDEVLSGQRIEEAAAESQFAINRDINSAALNEQLATLDSSLKQNEMMLDNELRTAFETTMQDARFSDEAKMQIVTTMNNIIRDTQEQITQVGMSDRTAEQQVSAINMIQQSRDAELAVYQDLLSSFNDWEWSTEFTPKSSAVTETAAAEASMADSNNPPSGVVDMEGGNLVSSDRKWRWNKYDIRWEAA